MKKLLILLLFVPFVSFGQNPEFAVNNPSLQDLAEEYYEKAGTKSSNKDYYGAIADLTKAAELGMDFAYFKRGVAKMDLNDIEGAIKDYTIYINRGGQFVWAFRERARLFYEKEMFQESLEDYLSSITVDPSEEFVSHPHYSIGNCRWALGDILGACEDWKKASEKGNKYATDNILKYCN